MVGIMMMMTMEEGILEDPETCESLYLLLVAVYLLIFFMLNFLFKAFSNVSSTYQELCRILIDLENCVQVE